MQVFGWNIFLTNFLQCFTSQKWNYQIWVKIEQKLALYFNKFVKALIVHCWKEQKIRIRGGLLSKWELSLGITLKELNVICFEMILISSYGGDIPITSGLILDVKSLIKQWDEITISLHINYCIRILNPHWWKYIR